MKNNKLLILILTVIGISLILYNLYLKSNNENYIHDNLKENSENGMLSEQELNEYTELFKKGSYFGFLNQEYDDIHNVNILYAVYDNYELMLKLTNEELIELSKEIDDYGEMFIGIGNVYDGKRLRNWYLLRTGHDISENHIGIKLNQFDSKDYYYDIHSDTMLQNVKCISGYKDELSIYHIKYQLFDIHGSKNDEVIMKEVLFKEVNNDIQFISNTLLK